MAEKRVREHGPNTPRTHNAQGQRVDEPVQCLRCLQAWPCEVEVLRRENTALLRMIHDLRVEVQNLGGDAETAFGKDEQ